jgi:hypothetical protein
MEGMEMKSRIAVCGVRIMDRVRNEDVLMRCGSEISIGERMDRNVLRVYVHVEIMDEKVVKIVYKANMEGSRGRGRPKLKWMDSVKAGVKHTV